MEVNKYFRKRVSALLKEYLGQGSAKPQVIGATRWNSQRTCLDTFLKNRPFYLLIVAQNGDVVDQRIRNIINNIGLYREAKNLLESLTLVATALDCLQLDSYNCIDCRCMRCLAKLASRRHTSCTSQKKYRRDSTRQ